MLFKYLFVFLFCLKIQCGLTLFEFPKETTYNGSLVIPISEEEYKQVIQLAVESIQRQKRFEENLVSYNIIVANGSTSHAQFLETFPNEDARKDDYVARKILKASQFLNAKCKLLNVDECTSYLSTVEIPASELRDECLHITRKNREGHYSFRRLLPARYKDGFHEMLKDSGVLKPRVVSNLVKSTQMDLDKVEDTANLIFVQWAQFIEHDLSKSAVTTMADGTPIECCNSDFFKLSPRHIHPACAPLEGVSSNSYAKISCLNYVRSALAVDPECKFGPAQQLNQATSSLDLSQLYGHTMESKNMMRTFVAGQLKTSEGNLLPLAESKGHFCAFAANSNKLCFMAGDNRVNSNPFMIFIYTLFLRSHNNIASKLKGINPSWSDERLYNTAKKININIYREIIFNEWLPIVLGKTVSNSIKTENLTDGIADSESGISNEFSVAAIRFYYSMLPNYLLGTPNAYQSMLQENVIISSPSTIAPERLFTLQDQFYKSEFLANPNKLEVALEAMLEQRAMKMDSQYADSVMKHFLQTDLHMSMNASLDALAWDIQRSRDHGLASYVKYLQVCAKTNIKDWHDLRGFIRDQDIEDLRSIYNNLEDIDLIIGGISEIPQDDSLLGPTFTCILGEQFSKLRRYEQLNSVEENLAAGIFHARNDLRYTGTSLICGTTTLGAVPQHIFLSPSETNRLVSCSDL